MIETSGLRKSFRTRSGRCTAGVDAAGSAGLATAGGELPAAPRAGITGRARVTRPALPGRTLLEIATIVLTAAVVTALARPGLRRVTLEPRWPRRVAGFSPFFWAASGMRALFAGHVAEPSMWRGPAIAVVLAAVAVAWPARLFARSLR